MNAKILNQEPESKYASVLKQCAEFTLAIVEDFDGEDRSSRLLNIGEYLFKKIHEIEHHDFSDATVEFSRMLGDYFMHTSLEKQPKMDAIKNLHQGFMRGLQSAIKEGKVKEEAEAQKIILAFTEKICRTNLRPYSEIFTESVRRVMETDEFQTKLSQVERKFRKLRSNGLAGLNENEAGKYLRKFSINSQYDAQKNVKLDKRKGDSPAM